MHNFYQPQEYLLCHPNSCMPKVIMFLPYSIKHYLWHSVMQGPCQLCFIQQTTIKNNDLLGHANQVINKQWEKIFDIQFSTSKIHKIHVYVAMLFSFLFFHKITWKREFNQKVKRRGKFSCAIEKYFKLQHFGNQYMFKVYLKRDIILYGNATSKMKSFSLIIIYTQCQTRLSIALPILS